MKLLLTSCVRLMSTLPKVCKVRKYYTRFYGCLTHATWLLFLLLLQNLHSQIVPNVFVADRIIILPQLAITSWLLCCEPQSLSPAPLAEGVRLEGQLESRLNKDNECESWWFLFIKIFLIFHKSRAFIFACTVAHIFEQYNVGILQFWVLWPIRPLNLMTCWGCRLRVIWSLSILALNFVNQSIPSSTSTPSPSISIYKKKQNSDANDIEIDSS